MGLITPVDTFIQGFLFGFLIHDAGAKSSDNNSVGRVIANCFVILGCGRAIYRRRWPIEWIARTDISGNPPGAGEASLEYGKIRLMWRCVGRTHALPVLPYRRADIRRLAAQTSSTTLLKIFS